MAIISCPECGREISDTIKKCINCGYRIKGNTKKKSNKNKVLIIITIICLTLIVIVGFYMLFRYYAESDQREKEYKNKLELDKIERKAEIDRQKEETRQNNIDQCTNEAWTSYTNQWNSSCKAKGLKDDCSLPSDLAESYESYRIKSIQNCIDRY